MKLLRLICVATLDLTVCVLPLFAIIAFNPFFEVSPIWIIQIYLGTV